MLSHAKAILISFLGSLFLSFCTQPTPPDEFDNLKAFDNELARMCGEGEGMRCYPTLEVKLSDGRVFAIRINGRGMKRLPKSIYKFENLRELVLEETAFDSLPNLKPFIRLGKVVIGNNPFRGPVYLRRLPASIETLILSRDAITEVIVDDTLPKLAWLDLTQNAMRGRINPSFCKLPALETIDLSSGCCTPLAQKAEIERAAKAVLCKQNVVIYTGRDFID